MLLQEVTVYCPRDELLRTLIFSVSSIVSLSMLTLPFSSFQKHRQMFTPSILHLHPSIVELWDRFKEELSMMPKDVSDKRLMSRLTRIIYEEVPPEQRQYLVHKRKNRKREIEP